MEIGVGIEVAMEFHDVSFGRHDVWLSVGQQHHRSVPFPGGSLPQRIQPGQQTTPDVGIPPRAQQIHGLLRFLFVGSVHVSQGHCGLRGLIEGNDREPIRWVQHAHHGFDCVFHDVQHSQTVVVTHVGIVGFLSRRFGTGEGE